MIYLLFILSLAINFILYWYIRKLLQKYWFDVEARQKFTSMLQQYTESLNSIYKLEELYGEEIIKKAITQTQFVVEACKEFKEAIDTEVTTPKEYEEEDDNEEEIDLEVIKDGDKEIIRLREGEKVSQKANNYKKVISER